MNLKLLSAVLPDIFNIPGSNEKQRKEGSVLAKRGGGDLTANTRGERNRSINDDWTSD